MALALFTGSYVTAGSPPEPFPASAHATILGVTLEKDTLKRMFALLGPAKRKRDPSVGDQHFAFGYCYCSAPDCAIRLTFELESRDSKTPSSYVLEQQDAVDARCLMTDKLSATVATKAGIRLGMSPQALGELFPGLAKAAGETMSYHFERSVKYRKPRPSPDGHALFTGVRHYANAEASFREGKLYRFAYSLSGEMEWDDQPASSEEVEG
jgi:hypothetical protein